MMRVALLALIAVACGSSAAVSAEIWSCEMPMTNGKTYKQEWKVSGDRMFGRVNPGGQFRPDRFFHVVLNNSDTLLAFFRSWGHAAEDQSTTYVLIAKSTGIVTEIDDIVMNVMGPQYKDVAAPQTNVGHCSLERP
jgi:hypothetical protein